MTDYYNHKFIDWFRYVDDIFAIMKCSFDEIKNYYPNIKFTVEMQSNNYMNFLDLSILRNDNRFKFDIYKKSTQTDHLINFNSNHLYQHKFS